MRSNLDAWNDSVMSNIVGVNEDRLKWLLWQVTYPFRLGRPQSCD
jgi:hypothetical protein